MAQSRRCVDVGAAAVAVAVAVAAALAAALAAGAAVAAKPAAPGMSNAELRNAFSQGVRATLRETIC